MEEKGKDVMEKLESPSRKGGEEKPILCQSDMDMKKIEETQDCLILDFDPLLSNNIHNLSKLFISEEDDDSSDQDLHVISQKGPVQLNPTIPLTFSSYKVDIWVGADVYLE